MDYQIAKTAAEAVRLIENGYKDASDCSYPSGTGTGGRVVCAAFPTVEALRKMGDYPIWATFVKN